MSFEPGTTSAGMPAAPTISVDMPEEPAGNLEPIPMSAIMIGAPNGEAPTEPTPDANRYPPVDPPGNAPGSPGGNADHEGSSATPSLKEKYVSEYTAATWQTYKTNYCY